MTSETIDKIREHYEHAKRKHPRLANIFYLGHHDRAGRILSAYRARIKDFGEMGIVETDDILHCEIAEIYEAYTDGRLADAKEECYDAIAVLLRMVDMIEAERMKPDADDSDIKETIADLREVER